MDFLDYQQHFHVFFLRHLPLAIVPGEETTSWESKGTPQWMRKDNNNPYKKQGPYFFNGDFWRHFLGGGLPLDFPHFSSKTMVESSDAEKPCRSR